MLLFEMTLAQMLQANAPLTIFGLLVLFALGYIALKLTGGKQAGNLRKKGASNDVDNHNNDGNKHNNGHSHSIEALGNTAAASAETVAVICAALAVYRKSRVAPSAAGRN
jgi:hypothetical protein